MTRYEFLHTLRAAMHGLPQARIDQTVADCERRFDEGIALGRSEADIARELGDPFAIAGALRLPPAAAEPAPAAAANTAANATANAAADAAAAGTPEGRHGVARAVRIFVSSLGLLVFNAFMAIPAMIYSILLMAFYIVAIAAYFAGIALTASSLSGVNEMSFNLPVEHVVIESAGSRKVAEGKPTGRVRVEIGEHGIHVEEDDRRVDIESAGDSKGEPAVTVRHGSEALVVADRTELRSLKVYHGIGIILGGILLLLLSAIVTKYTWIGMKRYVQMNIALLRTA